MHLIHKTFRFEAGHQLRRGCFTAACSNCIHGHSYKVEVTLASEELDKNDMVVDFGLVKCGMQSIIDEWDHALLLPHEIASTYLGRSDLLKLVSVSWNPTAEAMAEVIFFRMAFAMNQVTQGQRYSMYSVRVWETETSSAEYRKDD